MKERTIKQTVRIACERDLQVAITVLGDVVYEGYLKSYTTDDSQGNAGVLLQPKDGGVCFLWYRNMTKICFVDEPDESVVIDEPECGQSPARLRQKLEHAKRHQYRVAVAWRHKDKIAEHFSGVISNIDNTTVSFSESFNIDLASIFAVDIVIDDMPTGQPDEPYDIASEHWEWRPVDYRDGLYSIDPNTGEITSVKSPAQAQLQAAAPELADQLREMLNILELVKGPGVHPTIIYKVFSCIQMLRDLGIINVAPWYGENDK